MGEWRGNAGRFCKANNTNIHYYLKYFTDKGWAQQ
jgi:hypothetical protein